LNSNDTQKVAKPSQRWGTLIAAAAAVCFFSMIEFNAQLPVNVARHYIDVSKNPVPPAEGNSLEALKVEVNRLQNESVQPLDQEKKLEEKEPVESQAAKPRDKVATSTLPPLSHFFSKSAMASGKIDNQGPAVEVAKVRPQIKKRHYANKLAKTSDPIVKTAPTIPSILEKHESTGDWSLDSADFDGAPEFAAVDSDSPLDEAIERGLDETPQTENYLAQASMSATSTGGEWIASTDELPLEPKLLMVVGEFQQNHFTEARNTLAALKAESIEPLGSPHAIDEGGHSTTMAQVDPPATGPVAPSNSDQSQEEAKLTPSAVTAAIEKSQLVEANRSQSAFGPDYKSNVEEPEELEREEALAKPAPELVRPSAHKDLLADEPPPEMELVASAASSASVTKKNNSVTSQNSKLLNKSLDNQPPVRPTIQANTANQTVVMSQTRSDLLKCAESLLPKNSSQKICAQALLKKPVPAVAEIPPPVVTEESIDQKIYGQLDIDSTMFKWLKDHRGHLELYLQPVLSKEPQDTVFLPYLYPADRFEIETKNLSGSYWLIAGVYIVNSPTAVKQIVYKGEVSAVNYKKVLRFLIQGSDLNGNFVAANDKASEVVLSATLFEGLTGDVKHPKTVSGATVRVVGNPKLGEFISDADGNIRIPNAPALSELYLNVSAPGYYDTQLVVPTSRTNFYRSIYLVSRITVGNITKYFTKSEQRSGAGLIVGRVFGENRAPASDVEVSLSARKGKAVYIDTFPVKDASSTAKPGLFSFFNVQPSIRALKRSGGEPAMLLAVKPDSAKYVEFGRGGKRSLIGKVIDPYDKQMPPTTVSLVGDPSSETQVAADGTFEIPNLDFEPGLVTVEVKAKGFPRTLQDIAWNTRESERVHNLYMMPQDIFKEAVTGYARTTQQKEKGALIGGAETAFFDAKNAFVQVELDDVNGKSVSAKKGPFPLSEINQTSGPLLLTKQNPGFSFLNLDSGEYILKFTDKENHTLRTHFRHVGTDALSVAVIQDSANI
jgi:hypothetical protein